MDFWLSTVLLLVIATIFVFYPLFKALGGKSEVGISELEERKHQNVEIYKAQLKELEKDKESGRIDGQQFDQMKQELDANLLIDVEVPESEESQARDILPQARSALILSFGVVLVLGAGSYTLYSKWGRQNDLAAYEIFKQQKQSPQHSAKRSDMNALLEKLVQKMENDPENMDGWYLLGKSALTVQRYGLAADAFSRLAALLDKNNEDSAAVYGLVAQARYFDQGNTLNDNVQNALDEAFKRDANEANSLSLLGMIAFQGKEYQKAIDFWQRIINSSPDNPNRTSILDGIKQAKIALGQPVESMTASMSKPRPDFQSQPTSTSQQQPGAAGEASISVHVELDPALKAKTTPDDIVFVLAKAVSGPPMPLAVKRIRVKDLPIDIILDDSMAMAPMAKLSIVDKAIVIARVSKSGRPIPQPGDFEGKQEGVPVSGAGKIQIQINQEL